MALLLSYFSGVISEGLKLEERLDQNLESRPAAEIRAWLSALAAGANRTALAEGKRENDISLSAFAVVAWLDEVTSRRPEIFKGATPLQVMLFGTLNAGNEFFENLGRLTKDQDEVREVYYVILSLGFVGQYWREGPQGSSLQRLKELHGRQLPISPAPTHTLGEERLTSQPYEMVDPAEPKVPSQWDGWVLRGVLALAVAVPAVLLLYYFVSPLPKKAGPTAQEQLDRIIGTFDCAELAGKIDPAGAATVSGWVAHSEDIERINTEIRKITGVREVRGEVRVRIWPYCEVVALLKPYAQRNEQGKRGLQIAPMAGHSDKFVEGERIMVQLLEPNYDGYLYVDYYVIDGNVVHLFPNARDPNFKHKFKAGESFVVGEQIVPPWVIQPPFGQELITVIASPVPLFTAVPPEVQSAKDYLASLRKVVEMKDPQFLAGYLFLQTEKK